MKLHAIVLRRISDVMERRHEDRNQRHPDDPALMMGGWKLHPDQRIEHEGSPYLDRWFVVPKNDWPFGFLKRFMQHRWPSAPLWLHGAVGKFVDSWCINIYLHHFRRSDEDSALHDHPWWFNVSWLLDGDYDEMKFERGVSIYPTSKRYVNGYLPATKSVRRKEGGVYFRWGPSPHRVVLLPAFIQARTRRIPAGERGAWTLFITGPYRATWGFYCPDRWIHWKAFTENGRCDAPEEF